MEAPGRGGLPSEWHWNHTSAQIPTGRAFTPKATSECRSPLRPAMYLDFTGGILVRMSAMIVLLQDMHRKGSRNERRSGPASRGPVWVLCRGGIWPLARASIIELSRPRPWAFTPERFCGAVPRDVHVRGAQPSAECRRRLL